MTQLPSPDTLARLVSGVTETMFGMSFDLSSDADIPPWRNASSWRTAVLALTGPSPLTVAIASDPAAAKMLASGMFSCETAAVDPAMEDDSLSELLNIIAGQVKSSMGLGQTLGLPRLVASFKHIPGTWHSATMKHEGSEVLIWVALIDSAQETQLGRPQ